jgi:hypothetical protein
MREFALVSCLLAACASDSESELLDGFAPPPPGSGEVQYLSPITRGIQPGEDKILCSYLDAYIDEDFDIGRIAAYHTTGSHHVVLYTTTLSQPPNTHVCKDEEMVWFSLLGATTGEGGSAEYALPDGLVRRVRSGVQLVMQTHWLNASDEVIDGQAAFNVRYEPISPAKIPTDFLGVTNTEFEATPGASKASVECTFKDSVNIWQLGGHQHDLGTHVKITFTPSGGEGSVLFDEPWNKQWTFDPKLLDMSQTPMKVGPGDKLRVDCDWNNPHAESVRFPSEMCGAIGQFFPSDGQLYCANGDWLGD